jgi:hypothetical protein
LRVANCASGFVIGLLAPCSLAAADEVAWRWFADCQTTNVLEVQFQLDGTSLFSMAAPICQTAKQDPHVTEFQFHAPHSITWSGYGDEDMHTSSGQLITGHVWLAGGDPDALILGIDFLTDNAILMNTLHLAKPAAESVSTITTGLTVRTAPIRPIEATP